MIKERHKSAIRVTLATGICALAAFRLGSNLLCNQACQARHAAEDYVQVMAGGVYEPWEAIVEEARNRNVERNEFELLLDCLDWGRAEVGDVYDSSMTPDYKMVVLHAPSGDFALSTQLNRPEGDEPFGKGFNAAGGRNGECPPDANEWIGRWADE